MEKFIVTPKEDKSVTMTIRIDRALQEEYNDLAAKTNRSRNELISMALQYTQKQAPVQLLSVQILSICQKPVQQKIYYPQKHAP